MSEIGRTRAVNVAIDAAEQAGKITLESAAEITKAGRRGGVTDAERSRVAAFLAQLALDDIDGAARSHLQAFATGASTAAPPIDGQKAYHVRAPDYDRIFADGRLEMLSIIGWDEAGWHEPAISKALSDLDEEGFKELSVENMSAEELLARGIDPERLSDDLRYFHKPGTDPRNGEKINVVLRLLLPSDDPQVVESRYATLLDELGQSDVVCYAGHARYGSGPDIDPIDSPAGNWRIGTPYEAGHVNLTGRPVQIDNANIDKERYQLFYFSACTTDHYRGQLRSHGLRKEHKDFLLTNQLSYWSYSGGVSMLLLKGIMEGEGYKEMVDVLNDYQSEDIVHTDGALDNMYVALPDAELGGFPELAPILGGSGSLALALEESDLNRTVQRYLNLLIPRDELLDEDGKAGSLTKSREKSRRTA